MSASCRLKSAILVIGFLLILHESQAQLAPASGAFLTFEDITPTSIRTSVDVWCRWQCPTSCHWEYQDFKNEHVKDIWQDGGTSPINPNTQIATNTIENLRPETWYRLRYSLLHPRRNPVYISPNGVEVMTCPVKPMPVRDLAIYSVGPDWISLRWTPPPAEHCQRHLYYDVCVLLPEGPICNEGETSEINKETMLVHRSFAYKCPTRWHFQHCRTVRKGLTPTTFYKIEVVVRDKSGKYRSDSEFIEGETQEESDDLFKPSPPVISNVTNNSFIARINMSCEPFCDTFDVMWQIKLIDGNIYSELETKSNDTWDDIGEYPILEEVNFENLQPISTYQVRAFLRRAGEETEDENTALIQNVTTCPETAELVKHISMSTSYYELLVRWTPPEHVCASTTYRVNVYDSAVMDGGPLDFPCNDTSEELCIKITNNIVPGYYYRIMVGTNNGNGDYMYYSIGGRTPRKHITGLSLGGWSLVFAGLVLLGLVSVCVVTYIKRSFRKRAEDHNFAWRRSTVHVEPLPRLADDSDFEAEVEGIGESGSLLLACTEDEDADDKEEQQPPARAPLSHS